MRRCRVFVPIALLLLSLSMAGQQSQPVAAPAPKGYVSGHVFCADTRKPARFAEVSVIRRQETPPGMDWRAAREAASKQPQMLILAKARTALDGGFTIGDLPEGDYYVIATMAGYIVPLALAKDAKAPQPDVSEVMAAFPLVHVSEGRPATAEISLQRGGGISGTVRFDDGTPVAGAALQVGPAEGRDPYQQYMGMGMSQVLYQNHFWTTDDAGHYRISGLAPGKYLVQVRVPLNSGERMIGNSGMARFGHTNVATTEMHIYFPGTLHKSEAKAVEITGDEIHSDSDIEVALNGLHSLQGRVQAGEDLHAPAGSMLTLTDNDGFYRYANIASDGTFHFEYLPKGTYKLQVSGTYDLAEGSNNDDQQPKIARRYKLAQTQVVVDEHDVVMDPVSVEEIKPKKPGANGN